MNATRKNLTRLTVAGSSVALFAGLAVPAYACTQTDPGKSVAAVVHAAPTLAGLLAKVDARIDARLSALAAASTRVLASTTLTDQQKARATERIQAQVAALTALKAKVDAETTAKAVLADLRAAGTLWDWHRHDGKHRHGTVVITGRGHAVRSAGQHGFGQHGLGQYGFSHHSFGHHGGSQHR